MTLGTGKSFSNQITNLQVFVEWGPSSEITIAHKKMTTNMNGMRIPERIFAVGNLLTDNLKTNEPFVKLLLLF